ncbi:MAG TPA: O-antigen ligase family protein [Gammaproteobacteria bacterium]|nr:O-antigen ligase family protein [Gammaproteobacteria bacterium]
MTLAQIKSYFPGGGPFAEKALFVLLFLFPILSLSVRHWLSGAFSLIVLLSLVYAWRSLKEKPLYREEKILFGIFGLYFFSILLSSTVNGWTEASYHRLGTELKYLAFFPFYLYIRQYPSAWRGLILAIPLGGIVLGGQAIYDTYFTSFERANGIYGPIIFGDLGVLLTIFSLIFALTNRNKLWISINLLAGAMGMLAVIYSGSRNAWLAVVVSLIILPFLIGTRTTFWRVSGSYLAIITVAVVMIINTPSAITARVGVATEQFKSYFYHSPDDNYDVTTTSVGERLEMWRSALVIFRENPCAGIGPGNMHKEINWLAVSKNIGVKTKHGHVHNAYLEILGTQGIIGFLVFIAMLFYPLYIFLSKRRYDRRIAGLGIMLMSGFVVFSLTEVPFIHDNFSSIFLTFLSVFFAWIIHAKYESRTA